MSMIGLLAFTKSTNNLNGTLEFSELVRDS